MSNPDCRCVICHDYGDRADTHPGDQRVIDNVGQRGWGVIGILESATNGSFAFTVGLWHTYQVPEVAMFGMPPEKAIPMLNIVGDQVAEGARIAADQLLDGVLSSDYQVVLRPIDDAWRRAFFGTAMRFYRSALDWPALQCVWPDRFHRFPGDPECDPTVEGMQPRLQISPDEHPRDSWIAYYEEWLAWSRQNKNE